jgi:hypothetical protein
VSAELSARRTAAAAVLADFRSEYGKFLADPVNLRAPDYPVWVLRLAAELGSVLQRLEAEAAEPGPAAQLAEVRAVLDAFDWEGDDRQYALEKIDGIVNGVTR